MNFDTLFRLWKEATRRSLQVRDLGGGHYAVSSFSRTGKWHAASLNPQACSCRATTFCTHLALAMADDSLSLWLELMHRDRVEFERRRLALRLGAKPNRRERAAMALIEERLFGQVAA
jgi:hypothetical protein